MSRSAVPLLMLTAALASSCGLPEEETSPVLSTTAQAATPTQLSCPQYVRTCTSDPDITNTGGRISSVSDATHARTFQMSGNTRIGPNPRIYGWFNVPNVIPATGDSLYGQRQGFWKR